MNDTKKRIGFHKAQLAYLESVYGTYEDIGKQITTTSDIAMLNRLVGRQEVLDEIRKLSNQPLV
ncbi:hypothetical protein [Pantoea phage LIMEzero]|uniref:Uncharacterized protein n=1 Tax=Pantoea phage LIMEzero TaxID=943335 RepID=F4N9T7_9CAUD|nr:hypothetical protein LIMEzero_ORF34 [Pantoea phage LIMEzero]CBY88565.1 hypothetical protein [Pantoea phage LIMEzero]